MSVGATKRKRLDKGKDRIVIVGSGLAGLSCAIALEQAGFSHISLYERDDSFEQQKEGYGLTLSYNSKGPLASLGVLEQVAQQDCPSRSHYLFRPDGSILGYFGNTFANHRGQGQRGNLRVPRKVLRKLLFDKLKTTTVHWGCQLKDYLWNPDEFQYSLKFETIKAKSPSERIIRVVADLLVAADGIRSSVLSKLYRPISAKTIDPGDHVSFLESRSDGQVLGLRKMGIRLILGIADFSHPLLRERGFYTFDGKHRLFTMPYSSNRFDKSSRNRIMWQLSYTTPDNHSEDLDHATLRSYVLDACQSWHEPVLEMVQSTPMSSIWGTDLMDRDPKAVLQMVQEQRARRLVVVGDALHPMSPFKGQGANQALADGPLLANWLQKASIDSALTSFWREVVQRTAPVVAASRKAARELHSLDILQSHSFAGVQDDKIQAFLLVLQRKGVGASLGGGLDSQVLSEIAVSEIQDKRPKPFVFSAEQAKALKYAIWGETEELRRLSLAKHSESICTAVDSESRTCLHLAAISSHRETCKWLLAELGSDPEAQDVFGKRPIDYVESDELALLFEHASSK